MRNKHYYFSPFMVRGLVMKGRMSRTAADFATKLERDLGAFISDGKEEEVNEEIICLYSKTPIQYYGHRLRNNFFRIYSFDTWATLALAVFASIVVNGVLFALPFRVLFLERCFISIIVTLGAYASAFLFEFIHTRATLKCKNALDAWISNTVFNNDYDLNDYDLRVNHRCIEYSLIKFLASLPGGQFTVSQATEAVGFYLSTTCSFKDSCNMYALTLKP